jgi:hypothetical protein
MASFLQNHTEGNKPQREEELEAYEVSRQLVYDTFEQPTSGTPNSARFAHEPPTLTLRQCDLSTSYRLHRRG